MKRICAYCDKEAKLTKEHIWPKCVIKRLPDLDINYLGSKNKFLTSELVICDVWAQCNNEKLSKLDSYFCLLFDMYFAVYHESKEPFTFEYDYDLLLRSLLKITFNSSRTTNRENNFFEKFKDYILNGGKQPESIIAKLDIVAPSIIDNKKVYPASARSAVVSIPELEGKFVARLVSVNSYYFYIIISRSDFIEESDIINLHSLVNSLQGTIIHPYQNQTLINEFSNHDTLSAHNNFPNRNS